MKRLLLPESLVAELDANEARRGYSDEITQRENAYLLDPGMGPATYLTRDGRVLIDARDWDESGLHEADERETVAALVVGAKKTGVAALLKMLPPRPSIARDCSECAATGWLVIGTDVATGKPGHVLCFTCRGLGWVVEPT